MNRFNLFAFLSIVLFSLAILSCKKDDENDDSENGENLNNLKTGQIEIKGYAKEKDNKISFSVTTKTITIDWGDGKVDEITPNGVKKDVLHEYASSSDFQTILINTEDLTEIYFPVSERIHELRLGNCPKLQKISDEYYSYLSLYDLTVLEINKAESLTILNIESSDLTSLNLNGCMALTDLTCSRNQSLTKLDISKCTALTDLTCSRNQLLTTLDVSKCTALTDLDCYRGQLTALNVSGCKALTNLSCSNNQLTTLDVSGCTALTNLDCGGNQLTALDVSRCTALTNLSCSNNQLTALDVSGCTALTDLYCSSNKLTALDVSKCTALTNLYCSGNQLTTSALNSLFNSLPIVRGDSYISIYDNPGSSDCDRSIAENKGWIFMSY
jgi:hypothetical protein